MLLYDKLHYKAQNLNYGSYAKKNTSPEKKLGRRRVYFDLDKFISKGFSTQIQCFTETTVSTMFNTWVLFMRVELEPLMPSKKRGLTSVFDKHF